MIRPVDLVEQVRPIDLVDGTTYQLDDALGQWYDLSTWLTVLRPINLVDGTTTHRLRRSYDLMVGPINLADGTTSPLGRWYDLSTRPITYPLG
jgi:hypothetical protein